VLKTQICVTRPQCVKTSLIMVEAQNPPIGALAVCSVV